MQRFVLIIAGPSAGGKSTIAEAIMESSEKYELSRSATSRPVRDSEKPDEYIRCSKEEFLEKITAGEMIESTEYGGNYYGTPKAELHRIFSEDKIPLLVLDHKGVMSFKNADLPYPVVAVYLYEDINVIEQRLYDRELAVSPTAEKLTAFIKRKEQNISDYFDMPNRVGYYDLLVKNSQIPECVAAINDAIVKIFCAEQAMLPDEKRAVALSLAESAKNKAC